MRSPRATSAAATIALIASIVAIGIAAVTSVPVVGDHSRISQSCRVIQQFILSDVALRERLSQQPLSPRIQQLNSDFANRWRVYARGITCGR